MTERLTALLHAEADELDVPPPPSAGILRRARRARARHRLATGVGVAAALGVVATTGVVLQQTFTGTDRTDRPDTVDPAMTAYLQGGAYAVGSTVWFGDGRYHVDVQGKVKALYYTSEGVVVRTGKVPWTDSAGASHYALATPDGRLVPLSLTLGDVKPGTDPGSPYLVFGSRDGGSEPEGRSSVGRWALRVFDVRQDRVTRQIQLPGDFTWGGWQAPPVALDGTTAYVAMDDAMVAADLGTGWSRTVTSLPASYFPTVAGGHGERPSRGRGDEIVDVSTGRVVLPPAVPPRGTSGREFYGFTRLSPDGRYAARTVEVWTTDSVSTTTVYDLETGRSARLDDGLDVVGWTPDGGLLRLSRSQVSVCEPVTGACESHAVDLPRGTIRVGGNDNES